MPKPILTPALQYTGSALLFWYLFQLTQNLVSFFPPACGLNVSYVWILLGMGLASLPFVYLFRRFKFSLSLPKVSLETGRFLYIGVFGVMVTILKNIDVSWVNYKDMGLTVVVYTLCRLMLVGYVFILCLTLGSLVLKKRLENVSSVVFSFFLGASIYGIVMTCLGLLGLLHLWLALLLTVPVLYFAPPVMSLMVDTFIQTTKKAFMEGDSLSLGIYWLLGWLLVFGGGFQLFSNGLYPGPILNDEWEHYFHYYRMVLERGSLMPNEVWYHFYVSKGAGLFFLSGLLSDFLSAQLVSLCFVLMVGLILYDLLKSMGKEALWALTGVILFFVLFDGGFFRHHVVLTGYVAFLVWASIRLLENTTFSPKIFWGSLVLSVFYISFYLPPAAALLAVFFGLMALGVLAFKSIRKHGVLFLILFLATIAGVVTALGINYAFTGLGEMVPMKTFWALADQGKFMRVFGGECARFFLYEQSKMTNILYVGKMPPDIRLEWFSAIFRISPFQFFHFSTLFFLSAVLMVSKMTATTFLRSITRHYHRILVFSIFLFLTFLMSQTMFIESVVRISVFIIFFLTVTGVALVSMTADIFAPTALKRLFCGALSVILCFLAMAQTTKATDTTRIKTIGAYLVGRESFQGVMAEADRHCSSAVSFKFFTAMREKIGPTAKVLCLSYFPSPGYSFPGAGLVSEPSYTFGARHREILEGTPERAKELFKELNINHFIITRRSVFLPCTEILGNLFRGENLDKMFKVVLTDQDNFLLTWRELSDHEELPTLLSLTLELRQKRPLYYPFSEDFLKLSDDLTRRLNQAVDQLPPGGGEVRLSADLASAFSNILKQQMLPKITLEKNKTLLLELIQTISKKITPQLLKLIRESRQTANAQAGSEQLRRNAERLLIKKNLADEIRPLILQGYTEEVYRDQTKTLQCALIQVPYKIIRKID